MQAIAETVRRQQAFFRTGDTRAVDFRRRRLKRLEAAILAYENRFYDAFREDLHKPPLEDCNSCKHSPLHSSLTIV